MTNDKTNIINIKTQNNVFASQFSINIVKYLNIWVIVWNVKFYVQLMITV